MSYFVYMLASKRNGTLYVGVTKDLGRRAGEHRDKVVPGFTKPWRGHFDLVFWFGMKSTTISTSLSSARSRSKAGTVPGSLG
jgi:predicted GIY-YIG superfamily endonuclease